jgi:hypothetical protein
MFRPCHAFQPALGGTEMFGRALGVALVVLVSACTAFREPTTFVGEVTFGAGARAYISECGTQRVLTVGVMATGAYVAFSERYELLSANGTLPILAEISGVEAKSSGGVTIDSPKVLNLTDGRCAAQQRAGHE